MRMGETIQNPERGLKRIGFPERSHSVGMGDGKWSAQTTTATATVSSSR
jgi:hypothetical protein